MRIEGTHAIPGDPAAVYALLLDPVILADCIPGCQQLIAAGEGQYDMKMKLALAAVSGEFTGKVALLDQNPPIGYRLRVEGAGKLGFMKGEGVLTLSEAEGGTSIAYDGDVQIGGTFAAVGQRLLDTTARMTIRKFFDKLAGHARKPA
jgi:carbon monoxide dehydrogenase subunit G